MTKELLQQALIEAITDHLAQPASAPVVPDGWVLVPREPFPSQRIAGAVALMKASDRDLDCTTDEIAAAYRAMLEAAPQAVPAPAVREPLTDDEITSMFDSAGIQVDDIDFLYLVIGMVEQAHGIGTREEFERLCNALPPDVCWGDPITADIVRSIIATFAPAPVVPDGWVMVPNYRGYAALGTGQYLLDISGDANPAELIIHVATEAEKIGRTVGDLLDKRNPGEMIASEKMAVRLAFFSVAGLDALEQQLRILRETHFAAAPGSAPAVREPQKFTDEQLLEIYWKASWNSDGKAPMNTWERDYSSTIHKGLRAVANACYAIGTTGGGK